MSRRPRAAICCTAWSRRPTCSSPTCCPNARARFGLDYETLAEVNPRLVYGRASGHGAQGPEREAGGFDHTDFWARSGIGHTIATVVGEFVPQPGPAMGDVTAGAHLAGAICAALYRRERTGKGGLIDVSLLSTGVWMNGPAILASALYGVETIPRFAHADQPNPLVTAYTSRDKRDIYFAGIQTEKNWAEFCDILECTELVGDPRFATGELRLANVRECIAALDVAFAKQDLEYWLPRLERCPVPWSLVQSLGGGLCRPAGAGQRHGHHDRGRHAKLSGRGEPGAGGWQGAHANPRPAARRTYRGGADGIRVEWDEIEGLKAAGAVN